MTQEEKVRRREALKKNCHAFENAWEYWVTKCTDDGSTAMYLLKNLLYAVIEGECNDEVRENKLLHIIAQQVMADSEYIELIYKYADKLPTEFILKFDEIHKLYDTKDDLKELRRAIYEQRTGKANG